MLRLLLFLHHIAFTPHALHHFFITAHVYAYVIDRAEPDLEEPTEEAQAKDSTNSELSQGKLRCISPQSLTFLFKSLYLCYV
jgi:hypothetical protein